MMNKIFMQWSITIVVGLVAYVIQQFKK